MKLDIKILRKWKILRSKGDINELARLGEVSTVTVRTALINGECSESLLKVIGTFYEERTKLIKQFI